MKKFKAIKYALISLMVVLVFWKGFYIRKLSDRNVTGASSFDAKALAKKIWEEQLPAKLDSALSIQEFLEKTNDRNPATLLRYTNSLSIGNIRHAILTAEGRVTELSEDGFLLELILEGRTIKLQVELEYVYGNSLRDASGFVRVEDHPISDELNNISENLNSIVREKLLLQMKKDLKEGQQIKLVAAVELNTAHFRPESFSFIPLRYTVLP